MGKIINKMLSFAGFDSDDDEIEDDFLTDEQPASHIEPFYSSSKRSKVVNINTTTQFKVVILQPESFEDAKDIADHIKTKRPVVVNLEELDVSVARRLVDFLSGAVYGLDGSIQKIANGIFLIAPYNVGVMGDFKDELKNKGLFQF